MTLSVRVLTLALAFWRATFLWNSNVQLYHLRNPTQTIIQHHHQRSTRRNGGQQLQPVSPLRPARVPRRMLVLLGNNETHLLTADSVKSNTLRTTSFDTTARVPVCVVPIRTSSAIATPARLNVKLRIPSSKRPKPSLRRHVARFRM